MATNPQLISNEELILKISKPEKDTNKTKEEMLHQESLSFKELNEDEKLKQLNDFKKKFKTMNFYFDFTKKGYNKIVWINREEEKTDKINLMKIEIENLIKEENKKLIEMIFQLKLYSFLNAEENKVICTDIWDAATKGSLSALKFHYKENRTNLNGNQSGGYTPLHLAVINGNLEIVKFLISEKAIVDVYDLNGRSPLTYASEKGHLDILLLLLNNNAFINYQNATANKKETALHWAVEGNQLEAVILLKSRGADKNITNSNGRTPLVLANYLGNRIPIANCLSTD